jgi:hypothetical protein
MLDAVCGVVKKNARNKKCVLLELAVRPENAQMSKLRSTVLQPFAARPRRGKVAEEGSIVSNVKMLK